MTRFCTLFALLLPCFLTAQIQIDDQLTWPAEPEVIDWGGVRSVIYRHVGGVAGEGEGTYTTTFPANRPGRYSVEVVKAELEPFRPHPALDLAALPTELSFTAAATRQPEGMLGKVSGPALINGPRGPQRLISVSLRLRPDLNKQVSAATFATASVLREGTFYRIDIPTSGVYKITRGWLADVLNVPGLDDVDPRNIQVYGQPGGMLPETVNEDPIDDLVELAIQVEGEDDGSFDGGDYLLVYADGPDEERFDVGTADFVYEKNVYTTVNHLFLRFDGARGRRVTPLPPATGGPTLDTYDAYYHFEEDRINVLHELDGNSHGSGQEWFGDLLRAGVNPVQEYGTLFRIPDLVTDRPVLMGAEMAVRSSRSTNYRLQVNGQEATSRTASGVAIGRQEQSTAVRVTALNANFSLNSPELNVTLTYPGAAGAEGNEAWLDYISARATRRLSFTGLDQFDFRSNNSRNSSAATYRLLNPPADARVWQLGTDGQARQAELSNGAFSAASDNTVREYVAFRTGASLLQPSGGRRIDNQNLHGLNGADMIIITHRNFLPQAEELAEHRRGFSGLETVVVTAEQVYNEFSGGRDDAAALRNFARMLYERGGSLRYLLLFGDGSFDHRDIYGFGTTFLPTYQYQDRGQFTEVNSFPSDDFFGIFTAARGDIALNPDVSIGIGRLPVKSADEASGLVRKLIRYDTDPSALGDWRTRMVFVGDDEDGGIHSRDVNTVAQAVAEEKPDLNFDKLYFDLFPQQSLSAGERYPDISEGLDRAVFRGSLAITYLGHGGPRGWGQERVLTIPQVRNWQTTSTENPVQPPVFLTATCTFSNYDDGSFTSAGEELFLTPNGGAIALMTTTRPVFSTQNRILTENTATAMLERPNGQWRALGDIIRIAKNQTSGSDNGNSMSRPTRNTRKFTLLGDPATVIALPIHNVRTTAVDTNRVTGERRDTVGALEKISISGEVTDLNGNLLENFNGEVFPTIYDKPRQVTTLQQDPGSPAQTFSVQRSIIFRGRATVRSGRFSFEFVVPQDIDYSFGAGKVSYYARDVQQFTDASGSYDGLIIGGSGDGSVDDDEGPQVEVFLDDESFVDGGETGTDPVLLVNLADDLGINVTGNSIGHDLEAVLDEDTRNPIVLNDYYEADADDFRSGKVRYPLFDLEPGRHTISVRAWDVANNSARGTAEFIVADDGRATLTRVFNYPNPFTDFTCFQFDHTLIGQDVEALVQVYTVNGRLVRTLRASFPFSDGIVRQDDCIEWDGLDEYGDPLGRGVYLYQVRLRGDNGGTLNGELEKLVILK